MTVAALPSGFIGVLYQLLADLNVKQLVFLLIFSLVLGGAAAGAGSSLLGMFMRPTMRRMNEVMKTVSENSHEWTSAAIALKRIPTEQWFSDVAISLQGIAGQATELAAHTKSILEVEERIKDLEVRAGTDREAFATLKGAHDVRMLTGGCGPQSYVGSERRVVGRR
jgi:hypothetical protein